MTLWILAGLGALQAVGLWLATQALADRREIIDSIKELSEKVGKQNGRIALLEHRVQVNSSRIAWNGLDRRERPRRGMTEE